MTSALSRSVTVGFPRHTSNVYIHSSRSRVRCSEICSLFRTILICCTLCSVPFPFGSVSSALLCFRSLSSYCYSTCLLYKRRVNPSRDSEIYITYISLRSAINTQHPPSGQFPRKTWSIQPSHYIETSTQIQFRQQSPFC